MYAIHLECTCGHRASVAVDTVAGLTRDAVLARARCTRCGQRASDMRMGWDAGGEPLEGHRVNREGD